MIEMMNQDVMIHIPSYEAGLSIFSELEYDEVLQLMTRADSENSAAFRTQTSIAIPEYCKKEVLIKIQEIQQKTNWTAPMIIEYLNKVCYNNRFATLACRIFTLVGTGGPAPWRWPFPDR